MGSQRLKSFFKHTRKGFGYGLIEENFPEIPIEAS